MDVIKLIALQWTKFKEGKDEGYIYDESHEFMENLTRGEIQIMLDYIEQQAK